jgi:hypothetical protein
MGVSLPLPKPGALAGVSARFKAWWNGEPVAPAEAAAETGEAAAAPASETAVASDPARSAIIAAESLWGQGRTEPGDEASDVGLAAALGMRRATRLVLLGGDAGALPVAVVKGCDARIELHEADGLRASLAKEAARAASLSKKINIAVWDGSPGGLPKNRAEALMAMWRGTSQAAAEAHVFAIERVLKPGATALWLDLFAYRTDAVDPACGGHEGRGFLEETDFTNLLAPAGLELRSEQDWSPQLLDLLQGTWANLRDGWDATQARLIGLGGAEAAQLALQHVVTWRAREAALLSGRLSARRYMIARS